MNLTQTLNFLFVPEATLSIIFLVIFVMLFGFGIFIYRKCFSAMEELNENAESMYENFSNKLSPESFIRLKTDKISASEGIMEGLPDAFVSIGILATFIGLGVAIQGASELLSTDNIELKKLIDLLGIIAFKFQTSVWGILFSLIFRRLIVENYFTYRQNVIDNVRERLYENERDGIRVLLEKQNQLHVQKSSKDDKHQQKLIEKISDLQNAVVNNSKTTQEILESQLNEIQAISQTMANYVKASVEFTTAAKQFTQNTSRFCDYVDDYRQEVETFRKNLSGTIDSSFDKLTTSLEEIGTQQFDTLCEMKTGIENMQRIFLRDEDRFVEEIRSKLSAMLTDTGIKFKQSLDFSIDKVSNDYNSVLESFNEKFDSSIKKANADYTKEINHFGEVANTLSAAIKNIDVSVQNLHETLMTEQKGIVQTNKDSYDKVETTINDFTAATQKYFENMTDIYSKIDSLMKTMESTNNQALTNQEGVLREFTNAFISTAKLILQEQRQSISERMEKLDTTVLKIEDIAKIAGTEQIRLDNKIQELHSDVVGKYFVSVNELNNTISQVIEKLQQSIQALSKENAGFLNDVGEKINNSMEQSAKIQVENSVSQTQEISSLRENVILKQNQIAEEIKNISNVISKFDSPQEITANVEKLLATFKEQLQQENLQREKFFESLLQELKSASVEKRNILPVTEQKTIENVPSAEIETPSETNITPKINTIKPPKPPYFSGSNGNFKNKNKRNK